MVAALAAAVAPAAAQSASPARVPPAASGPHAGLDRGAFAFYPAQPVWSKDIAIPPTAAGAVTATRVFIPFTDGKVYALSLVNGEGAMAVDLATKLAPVIDGPRVLVTGERAIDAFLAADGTRQWTAPLAAEAAFAPVARGGWIFVALANGSVVSRRSDTGASVWATPLGPPAAPIVVEGDRLYAATTGGGIHALAVLDGQPVWRAALDSDVTALAAVEGHVFAATSGRWLYALDAARGRVRWRFRIQGAAIGLAVDEDRVVAVMLDQSARAFKIRSGAQAWRQELAFRPAGGPIISGGSVLVTGYAPSLRALDRRTGANQGSYVVPLAVDASGGSLEALVSGPLVREGATVFDDLVILITQQGLVHAARRAFDPPVSPLGALPGTPVAVPAPPPGMPEAPATATPASTPQAAPTTPTTPAATAPARTPPPTPGPRRPAGGTPPRTPPAPPAR